MSSRNAILRMRRCEGARAVAAAGRRPEARDEMAHQSLYRKYRPQTFPDVVGQDHITRTLRNAVEEGSVAHAYLFCGPRGTGKTTTARILAKALDCVKGPTPDPDDTCENCREIAEGRHPDVYELDAASRRSCSCFMMAFWSARLISACSPRLRWGHKPPGGWS